MATEITTQEAWNEMCLAVAELTAENRILVRRNAQVTQALQAVTAEASVRPEESQAWQHLRE